MEREDDCRESEDQVKKRSDEWKDRTRPRFGLPADFIIVVINVMFSINMPLI